MDKSELQKEISQSGLKVTPQRIAVLEALVELANHPTVDEIVAHIKVHHPSIATGTVYKALEVMKNKGLIMKVITDKQVMRYDAVLQRHHHLYNSESGRIEDYHDEDLNQLLEEYFKKNKIDNFQVKDLKLYITGEFLDN